jgi:hypothetical protein
MRSTKAETEARIEQVYKLLLGGATYPDIRDFANASEQAWNVGRSQIKRYMTAAHARMKERYQARADHAFHQHMLRREQLYAHCMGAGDFSTALRVLQDEAKLEALYPPEKRELTGKDGGPIQTQTVMLTDDQRAAAVANILAAVGTPGPGPDPDGPGTAP